MVLQIAAAWASIAAFVGWWIFTTRLAERRGASLIPWGLGVIGFILSLLWVDLKQLSGQYWWVPTIALILPAYLLVRRMTEKARAGFSSVRRAYRGLAIAGDLLSIPAVAEQIRILLARIAPESEQSLARGLETMQRENRRARDIVRSIANSHKGNMRISQLVWRYEVQPNGDGICERRWTIVPEKYEALFDDFEFACRGESAAAESLQTMKPRAWDVRDNRDLVFMTLDDRPFMKRVLVLFHSPVKPGEQAEFGFRYTWAGLWKGLVDHLRDEGMTRPIALTNQIVVEVALPPGLEVVTFAISPTVEWKLSNNKRTISWTTAISPVVHEYIWEITCQRVE